MPIRKTLAIGGVVVALGAIGVSQEIQRLTPAEARQHVGETATVCGVVTAARCDGGKTTLLDLRTLTGEGAVSVAVTQANRAAFGDRLASRHDLRDVCATGPIERMGMDYRVVVATPDRLRIEREPPAGTPGLDEAFTVCDQGVSLPVVQRQAHPQYTSEAMRAHIAGTVMLQAVVGVDGVVRNPRILHGLDPGLDEQAVKAFSQWRFSPGRRDNQPVPVLVMVEMTFTMK